MLHKKRVAMTLWFVATVGRRLNSKQARPREREREREETDIYIYIFDFFFFFQSFQADEVFSIAWDLSISFLNCPDVTITSYSLALGF